MKVVRTYDVCFSYLSLEDFKLKKEKIQVFATKEHEVFEFIKKDIPECVRIYYIEEIPVYKYWDQF